MFCHSDFRSMDAFKGVSAATQNDGSWQVGNAATSPWDRIKVGTLERLENRYFAGGGGDDTDTTIHGTLYTRGTARTLLGWSGQFQESVAPTLRSTLTTPGSDKITNSNGVNNSLVTTDCSNYATNTACTKDKNFYTNYPTDIAGDPNNIVDAKKDWPDGPLPSTFPLPIPEDPSVPSDRKTDYNEWNKVVSASIAGSSDDYPKGTLTASMKVYASSNTSTVAWPTGSAQSKTSTDLGQGGALAANNVVIDGSTTPINIDKTVFINGDVVIRGRVRGQGTIIASGNVYVEGDLTYDCGSGGSTADCDYNNAKTDKTFPSLNLISAGNTMVGDYQSRFRLSDGRIPDATLAGNLNNAGDVEAGFDGGFNIKGSSSRVYKGCVDFWKSRDPNVSVSDWAQRPENLYTSYNASTGKGSGTGPRCTVPTLAAMETGNFNRLEMRKWAKAIQQGKSYTPRFYNFQGGEGVYFLGTNEEHSRQYENYTQADTKDSKGNYMDVKVTMEDGSVYTLKAADVAAGMAKAAKVSLSPNGGTSPWIKPSNLKSLFISSMSGRKTKPLRYDGLLYSANAVFALSQGDGSFSGTNNDPSPTAGRWDLRGSIVAADTGILTPKGLTVYYDKRLSPAIQGETGLNFFRSQWQVKAQ